MKVAKTNLRKQDALRVETAQKWLILGKPTQALRELHQLPRRAWRHPMSERILWRAALSLA
jgi:hypothetical protein